ncbi:MAG TPA: SusC/RagA family TonB-linked outer membrane protein [Longimicrobiales bacterium]
MRSLAVCLLALLAGAPLQAQQTPLPGPLALAGEAGYLPLHEVRAGTARWPAPLARPVTLRARRIPLERALEAIARQANLGISYGEDLVRSRIEVSLDLEHVSAADALQLATRGTGWQALVTRSGQVTVVRAAQPPATAAAGTIAGRVTDLQGEPLPGASVVVVGTQLGALTGENGRYTITGVPAGTYQLRASLLGYSDQTVQGVQVADAQTTTVDFRLQAQAIALDEIVAVGYIQQSSRNITGSVTTVSAERINPVASASVNQLLQGQAPGLNLTTRTAQPGGGVSVNIRGAISPRGNNTPLYVVDGVPITEYRSSVPGLIDADLGFYGGIDRDPLSYLNPSDIESVTVLKDASAAAIYGSAAANGVVLITTKSGRTGNVQVSYRSSFTAQTPHKYFPLMTARDFMEQQSRLSYERYLYDNRLPPYGNRDPATAPPFVPLFSQAEIDAAGRGTDWLGLITRSGFVQEHNITLTGGSPSTVAYASFNYMGEDGILRGSSLNRYSGRINLDQTLSDAVRLSLRLAVSQLRGDNASTGANSGGAEKFNMLQAAYAYAPTVPVYDDDGNYSYTYDRLIMNPAAFLTIEDQSRTTSIFATPNLEIALPGRLKLNVVGELNQETTNRSFYLPRTTNNAQFPDGMAQKSEATVANYGTEAYLTYNNRFGANELTVVGGAGYYRAETEGSAMQGVGFFTDAFTYNNIGVSADKLRNRITSSKSARTKLSQFARVNYSLLDRYILSLVARRDGSSIFAEKRKYGFFPGISAAWILSEESFLQGIPQLSHLKLRVGYGLAGNESVLSGNTLQLYSPGYPFLIGETLYDGVALSQVANPFLTWEKVYSLNAGIDFGLWDQKVSGSVDYFVKTARNLLDFNPLPSNNAVGRVADNVGATRSAGFELALNTRTSISSLVQWGADLSVSYSRAHWLERNPQVPLPSYMGERDPLDAIYGWRTDGIIRSPADRPAHMPDANLGNLRYVDQNGDGVLDSKDVVILGNNQPRWSVGLGNRIAIGNLDLNVFVYGNLGYKRYNTYGPNTFGISQPTNPTNTTVFAKDIWSSTNPNGTRPGVAANPYNNRNPASTDFDLEDASFLRLENVSLGYALPPSWFGGRVQRARVFLDLRDLGVWTRYPGFDPEYTEPNPYPKYYSTTIGVELRF